jgi:uncharacterized integral membrane protein
MAERDDQREVEARRASPALIAGIVLALAAIDFVVQNRGPLTIHFLFFDFESRVWTALLVTSVFAIVATELLSRVIRHNRHKN